MRKLLTMFAVFLLLGSSFASAKENSQVITLTVTDKGFEPNTVDVKPGTPVVLKVTRKTDETCAKEIKILSKKITKALPLNKEVSIQIGSLEKGEIRFACGMDMMGGIINVH